MRWLRYQGNHLEKTLTLAERAEASFAEESLHDRGALICRRPGVTLCDGQAGGLDTRSCR
jgi:hypothetical protein